MDASMVGRGDTFVSSLASKADQKEMSVSVDGF